MPKLTVVPCYYEPLKVIGKSCGKPDQINGQELFEYLNSAYRQAIRKILLSHPASFADDSPIFDLCIDVILCNNEMSQITVKWIEKHINIYPELKALRYLQADDPDFKKLQLIKTVTRTHQANLAVSDHVIPYVNSMLALSDIFDKENRYDFFSPSGKNAAAIATLKEALRGEQVDLLAHLPVLRKDNLGNALRTFVRLGLADHLLEREKVKTVSAFITALHKQVNSEDSFAAEVPDLGDPSLRSG